MSKRLHVVSKHQEYGSAEGFNWKYEEFHALLDDLNCAVECGDDCSDEFECGAEYFKEAIDLLKDYKDCKENNRLDEFKARLKSNEELDITIEELEKDLKGLGGIDYVLPLMERFYEERDKESWWISFVAW